MAIRETILSNLETELKKISVANEFNTNVNLVSRDFKGFDQCQSFELPALFIVDDGTDDRMGMYKENSTIYVLRKMQVFMVGYVRATKNISTVFNKFLSDIRKKIESISLGDNVRDAIEGDRTVVFSAKNHLIFQMPIEILYFYDKSNP